VICPRPRCFMMASVLSSFLSARPWPEALTFFRSTPITRSAVEQEQQGAERAQYGNEILRELAARLTAEFGKGFSRSNLEYVRRFYLVYPDRISRIIPQTGSGKFPVFAYPSAFPISQTASGESSATNDSAQFPFTLSWSHYVFLLGVTTPNVKNRTLRKLDHSFEALKGRRGLNEPFRRRPEACQV
jgi:hypothetical protein